MYEHHYMIRRISPTNIDNSPQKGRYLKRADRVPKIYPLLTKDIALIPF